MSKDTKSPRRGTRIALLVLGAALSALLLNQCRLAEDRITAPRSVAISRGEAESHGNCISECARAYADSARTENQLHEGILEACTTDECREAENARYAEVSARIIAGRKECFAGCHHQGGGSGGR